MSRSASVIIPTYNRAGLLGRAIDSALAAIAPGDEVIVADDGSTDATDAVVAAYGERVRHLRLPQELFPIHPASLLPPFRQMLSDHHTLRQAAISSAVGARLTMANATRRPSIGFMEPTVRTSR